MRETQRAYGEGYAPETNLREGSGWRAPSRRGLPTPPRPGARPVAAPPALPAPYWQAVGLVLLLLVLVGWVAARDWLGARDAEHDGREAYCAAVYAGQSPDWRHTYFEQCAGPKLKKPRS